MNDRARFKAAYRSVRLGKGQGYASGYWPCLALRCWQSRCPIDPLYASWQRRLHLKGATP